MQREFTKQAEKVLSVAGRLAKKLHHPYVGTEHLLLALRKEFTVWQDRFWLPIMWRKIRFFIL